MNAKHTPGPWFAGIGWIGAGELKNAQVIARIDNYPRGQSEANARLIAAAPELLGAAKVALEMLRGVQAESETNPDAMPWPQIDNLDLAIQKAEAA